MQLDHNASILVVDDEEGLADLVASALRFAGYEAHTEGNGYDALRRIQSDPPDLVVLDVNMPELDGFEVCRRIRRDGIQTPVIFLTARDDIDDLRTGFRQGGDDYLTKPFSLEELGSAHRGAAPTVHGGRRRGADHRRRLDPRRGRPPGLPRRADVKLSPPSSGCSGSC